MPVIGTEPVLEGKGFLDFVLAHFPALPQRELGEKENELLEARQRLDVLKGMSDAECEQAARQAYDAQKAALTRRIEETKSNAVLLQAMQKIVEDWDVTDLGVAATGVKVNISHILEQKLKFESNVETIQRQLDSLTCQSGPAWKAVELEKALTAAQSAQYTLNVLKQQIAAEKREREVLIASLRAHAARYDAKTD